MQTTDESLAINCLAEIKALTFMEGDADGILRKMQQLFGFYEGREGVLPEVVPTIPGDEPGTHIHIHLHGIASGIQDTPTA